MLMDVHGFIAKWRASELKEKSAAQEHFLDLCHVLGEPTPAEVDKTGVEYCFERGASKDTGNDGFADVWKRGHFGWEYKSPEKNLDDAFSQLRQYALALENPPLLIVSDMKRFRITTNWTNSISVTHEFELEDLADSDTLALLKAAFSDPDRLLPGETRQAMTERAAESFAAVAQSLRDRRHEPAVVAQMMNRLVFCMFADDVGLLPDRMFDQLLERASDVPDLFADMASALFAAMSEGGSVGFVQVPWFNGRLFSDDTALPLEASEINIIKQAASLDWSQIDPSILGTLFERGLDPDKRSQLGAHYTDRDKIMQIVEPVVVRPWRDRWAVTKAEIENLMEEAASAPTMTTRRRRRQRAQQTMRDFLTELRSFRVLDPACGSGNFLYIALQELKDLEHQFQLEAESLGIQRSFPQVSPENVRGVEINPYAAELARVAVWVGQIQWMRRNGFTEERDPILKPIETIECRDAILATVPADDEGDPIATEPDWPEAHAIVGNPPFLGGKLLRESLGDSYVNQMFDIYKGRVPAEADLVCYWFDKACRQIKAGVTDRVGLVATNSIRSGPNRRSFQQATENLRVFEAWSDEPWVVEGAAVRVSLICLDASSDGAFPVTLDGKPVGEIFSDLTGHTGGTALNPAKVRRLAENRGASFMGTSKVGAFEIETQTAHDWLRLPANPNGRPNSDVVRPWVNGQDLTRRSRQMWVVDFGTELSEAEAALYEQPFEWIVKHVLPQRLGNKRALYRDYWWRHAEPRPGMRLALRDLRRYIATPRLAKHRVFVWCDTSVCPDSTVTVIARDDDTTLGILQSRFHVDWSRWLGSEKVDRPRYTSTTTFETFTFPEGMTPDTDAEIYAGDPRAIAIAEAAERLVELRDRWLHPPEWVVWQGAPVPGFPPQPTPVDDDAAHYLKERTLTNLYNTGPQWLQDAHAELDATVAAAYGWPADISAEDALAALMELNQSR